MKNFPLDSRLADLVVLLASQCSVSKESPGVTKVTNPPQPLLVACAGRWLFQPLVAAWTTNLSVCPVRKAPGLTFPQSQVSRRLIRCSLILPSAAIATGFLPECDKFSITTWLFRGPLSREVSRNFTTGPELMEVESRITMLPSCPAPVASTPKPHVSNLAPCTTAVNPPPKAKAVVQNWKDMFLKFTC